jgi:hypothetical protein
MIENTTNKTQKSNEVMEKIIGLFFDRIKCVNIRKKKKKKREREEEIKLISSRG